MGVLELSFKHPTLDHAEDRRGDSFYDASNQLRHVRIAMQHMRMDPRSERATSNTFNTVQHTE